MGPALAPGTGTPRLAMERPMELRVREEGIVPYADALAVQTALAEARWRGAAPDTLLLLQHPATVTLGRRASLEDVYRSEAELRASGIALERTTRGGLVTYHGPGQLVGYPVLKLHALGPRVPDYVHGLEALLVECLAEIGVRAWRDDAHVGVWTPRGKIAQIGIAQSRGVTLHGFAVNLQPDLSAFELINPCGLRERGVTSARQLLGHEIDITSFGRRVAEGMGRWLGLTLCWETAASLAA